MPEPIVHDWTLQLPNGRFELCRFEEETGVLQVNGERTKLEKQAAQLFGILVSQPDTPLTSEDLYDSGMQTRGGQVLRKAMRDIGENPYARRHAIQVGVNATAVFAFLTNPDDAGLVLQRMADMHQELYADGKGADAKTSHKRVAWLSALAGSLGAAAAGYSVIRKVHKRQKG